KMAYPVSTVLTLDNALKIIMVKSANDVATAIGESIAGSTEAFAARMNAEARRIGMTGSHFVNAHGLHSDDQYTTAHDLAVLALALRTEFPDYAPYFSIEAIGAGEAVIPNHNNLIGRFSGADGMKTGYTCPSGFNLVATATRNGRTMLAVVIGAKSVDSRADKAAELLAQGFATPPSTGITLATLPVSGNGVDQAFNMRDTVCATKTKKQREAEAAEARKTIVVPSPHLASLSAPRMVTQIVLGGATGPASPFMPKLPPFVRPTEIDGIPIPIARPDNATAPETSAQAPAAGVTQ
ncbi:MAG: D-alanyl-D-alanine carboxypeptidase family protein, partial [Mesorhizobium sp.]|nr:D-alanyl-D-alanine carboxypeptidase family protein [Mesorhizobium sp.]